MKSSVIVFPGSNCDRDIAVALEKLQFKNKSIILMVIYTLPRILSFAEIEDKISVTLHRLIDEV